jgi:hypothetical protein
MIPQPEVMAAARREVWRELHRTRLHGAINRPMDRQTEENIRLYWKSILELKEEWLDGQTEIESR